MSESTEALVNASMEAAKDVRDQTFPAITMRYRFLFTLVSMVGGLSSVCIKQVLLPIQVSTLDPVNTNTSFAVVAAIGACAGLIASPLSGALSDRTTWRWGRRRPWIGIGVLVAVIGLLLMAQATTIAWLALGEIVAQIGVDTVLSTVTAIIPDQVPPARRPLLSALNGMAPIVGGVLGLLMVTVLTNTKEIAQGYYVLAGVSLLFTLPFLIILRETPLSRETRPRFHLFSFLKSFVSPLRSRDFCLVLLSRCLVFLSFTILGAYLLFSLRTRLHVSTGAAAQEVTMFQLLSTGALLPMAILGGIVAHLLQRLKPFVLLGALIMAIGLLLIAFLPIWGLMLVAAVIFGAGFGLYLGVDIALAVMVLPKATESGKDLGILYMSIFLPLILSPIIGASVLNGSHNNFTLLFAFAALSSVLAAGTLLPIRSVL